MTRPHTATAIALGAFTLLTYFQFPGHTWLQQDSQIYVAMFEHLDNPSVLARDIVCVHPHVKWTIYDETTRALHNWSGLSYRNVLDAQMLLFRFFGLAGVFLIAAAAGLNRLGALFVAFLFGLGAFIGGPEILTLEYEPVPRGFALMLVLLALGYGAFGRWRIAVVLAGIALLYHPPTSAPFWLAAVVYTIVRRKPTVARNVLAGYFGGAFLLLIFAAFQTGEHESQPLFARIPDDLVTLMRYRGAYNWVDLWKSEWLVQYALLTAFAAGAWMRLRKAMDHELTAMSFTLIVYGILSVPLSWLTLNVMRWSMMPQFQPARAVLFVVAFAIILGAAAGWRAAQAGRWLEATLWLIPILALPANRLIAPLFAGAFSQRLLLVRCALIAALAVTAVLILTLSAHYLPRWPQAASAALLVPLAAVFLIPGVGQVVNYPPLHTPSLESLGSWARANTRPDSIFHFADTGRVNAPGVFRIQSLRAVYVDWKGGGQVNQSWAFAREWRQRWEWANRAQLPSRPLRDYRQAGIDYLVVDVNVPVLAAATVYQNDAWRVIDLSLVDAQ